MGRLDKASEGLLLLTNDSEWAARIAAPESHIEKTYDVQVSGMADESVVEALQKGVLVPRMGVLKAARGRDFASRRTEYVALDCARRGKEPAGPADARRPFGLKCLRLVRVAVGPLQLGDLPKGAYRQLTASELAALGGVPNSLLRGSGERLRT